MVLGHFTSHALLFVTVGQNQKILANIWVTKLFSEE
jgi:hypothetical protein